jgi:hypothetical protein
METTSPIMSSCPLTKKWCFAGETAHEDWAGLRLLESRLSFGMLCKSARILRDGPLLCSGVEVAHSR